MRRESIKINATQLVFAYAKMRSEINLDIDRLDIDF